MIPKLKTINVAFLCTVLHWASTLFTSSGPLYSLERFSFLINYSYFYHCLCPCSSSPLEELPMGAHWAPISACNKTTGNLWCLNYCFKVYVKVIANKVTILNVYALMASKCFMMFSCNSKSTFLKFTNQGWFSRWRYLLPSLTTWVQFPFWKQRKNNLHIPQRNKTKVAQQGNSFCKKGAGKTQTGFASHQDRHSLDFCSNTGHNCFFSPSAGVQSHSLLLLPSFQRISMKEEIGVKIYIKIIQAMGKFVEYWCLVGKLPLKFFFSTQDATRWKREQTPASYPCFQACIGSYFILFLSQGLTL